MRELTTGSSRGDDGGKARGGGVSTFCVSKKARKRWCSALAVTIKSSLKKVIIRDISFQIIIYR
jgi:hypothetical protein